MNESVNGNNENEEKLIINIGEAYMPVVEDYKRAKESMFKPIYEKGHNLVKEICEAYRDKYSTNEYKISSENYNNIIAFIGERGSGKTSSMLTFSNLLNDEEFLRNGLSKNGYDKDCIEFKFVQSDVIDPSQFDKNVNILEIILAGMFKNFKNKADKIESTDRQKIIEYFDKVYRNLKTLKKESSSIYDGEVLEALLEMSASMEIKENLSNLISVYLEKVENESNKNSILVIRIDDIDLNTEHAHAMVEQLRKYLMLPRVIILMALKIDQLNDVVNQTHYISLSELAKMEKNDGSKNCISINDKVIDMTEKYLSKLFPIDHRLLMPDLDVFSSSKKFQINMKIEDTIFVEKYPSLDYGIRELIYRKTGLHFIKPDKNENPIVPSNLRELVNFVHYLKKFEDVKITSKEKLIRCMNAIVKNQSGNKILDDEIKKKLQTAGKTLEDFSWLLDCPLTDDENAFKALLEENKRNANVFEINDNYNELKTELEKIDKEEKEKNKNDVLTKKQLEKFKNYFLSYWCQNKVSRDGQLLITRFLALDARKRNKFVILELEKMFRIARLLKVQKINTGDDKIKKYLDNYNQIYMILTNESNISLGDVLFTLSILDKLNISKDVSNIIFAIKTLYYIELEILNLLRNNSEKQSIREAKHLIGGEYFSDFQKKIIYDERGGQSRTLRECKISKIQDEIRNLEDNHKLPTMLFMNLMFKRTGKVSENYRTDDNIYYDFYEKLQGNQKNYVLSVMSPFFNSHRAYEFINSKVYNDYIGKNIELFKNKIIREEEFVSNIILIEHLFIEKCKIKNENFTNSEQITSCWHEFYEGLNSRIRFFDEISYFSIFNMNFMRIFRKANIKNIDILENGIDKLVDRMEKDKSSRKYLENYWNEHYLETKKDINADEEIKLDILNNYINDMDFLKINNRNTSSRLKETLIEILKSLSFNKSEEMGTLLKRKEKEWLENNPNQKSEYAKKYFQEANDYSDKKMYEKAIELFNKALEFNPYEISYLNNLGRAYNNLGYLDKAIEIYISALNNKDKCTKKELCVLSANLSRAYADRNNMGDIELAFKLANEAIDTIKDVYYGYYSLAKVYKSYGKYYDPKKSIDTYEIALTKADITEEFKKRIEDRILECKEKLESIESQTEEPQETNLEDLEPEDKE